MTKNNGIIGKITITIIFLYILLRFYLLPLNFHNYLDISFAIISIFLILLNFFIDNKQEMFYLKRFELIILTYLSLTLVLVLITSEYKVIYTTSNFLFIIIIYFLLYKESNREFSNFYSKLYKIFYYGVCTSLVIQLFYFFDSWQYTEGWYLTTTWDKNYSGVILFLFFLFSYKNKFKIGVILAILFSFILGSRGFILMLLLFFITKYFKKYFYKLFFRDTLILFIFIIIGTYFFSVFWVDIISSVNVQNYQEGINDTSNRMRFLANINAYEMLIENRHLLIYGFDQNLTQVLGVDFEDHSYHTLYEGLRLVQTHNSFLSLILKTGIMFSFFYLLLLSRILNKYNMERNFEYIFPFLINSLIMHSMINTSLLLFWIVILHIPNKSNKLNMAPNIRI